MVNLVIQVLFKIETIGSKLHYFEANLANFHGEIFIFGLKEHAK